MLTRIQSVANKLAEGREKHQHSLTTRTFTRITTKAGQRTHTGSAVTTVYKPGTKEKTVEDRQISANIIHGSDPAGGLEDGALEFFTARRKYGFSRRQQRLMPAWERMAHSLIVMTRKQPRVFPEMAFRTMALFLKMLMVVRVTETKMLLLPSQAAQNMENVVGAAKAEAETKAAEKKDGNDVSSATAKDSSPAEGEKK